MKCRSVPIVLVRGDLQHRLHERAVISPKITITVR